MQQAYLLLAAMLVLVTQHRCPHLAAFPMLFSPVMVNACAWLQVWVQVHAGCAAAAADVAAALVMAMTAAAAVVMPV
jgi:hypothetical protein